MNSVSGYKNQHTKQKPVLFLYMNSEIFGEEIKRIPFTMAKNT
jgi:hypothetical protein